MIVHFSWSTFRGLYGLLRRDIRCDSQLQGFQWWTIDRCLVTCQSCLRGRGSA